MARAKVAKYVGKVKWFNTRRGYGFISSEEAGGDFFVHYSSIEKEGFKSLKANEEVTFELEENEKGSIATHVVSLGS